MRKEEGMRKSLLNAREIADRELRRGKNEREEVLPKKKGKVKGLKEGEFTMVQCQSPERDKSRDARNDRFSVFNFTT